MPSAADIAEIKSCKQAIQDLKTKLEEARSVQLDNPLQEYAKTRSADCTYDSFRQRKMLKGHFGKIYSMHWGTADAKSLVSASQDGKLIIWNAWTANMVNAVPLRSSWVMTTAFSPSGQFVAGGGLDNLCTIYKLPKDGGEAKTHKELAQHEGYLSCCRFIDDSRIISSSGDSSCILWDIESYTPINVFTEHESDCMSVSLFDSKNIFVSGSCDSHAKLWDWRVDGKNSKAQATFYGHESDINSVQFFPDGNAFGTGSDDSSCRIFDIRAKLSVNIFSSAKILCGITSVDFSRTGRYMFVGYDDYACYAWNTAKAEVVGQPLHNHDGRVSCLGVNAEGKALCTGSWDQILKIWA